ncbi:MAG: serine hydrolase [Anaeromyxobacteraceae bacterium]
MLVTALLLTLAAAGSPPKADPRLDALLDAALSGSKMPAAEVAVVQGGKVVASSTRGVREAGKADRVTEADRFLVGSCTKPMTRMLLLRLAQAGKVDLGKTLAEVLPDVPMQAAYREASLRDVLRHTAGLQPYTEITPVKTPGFFELKGKTPVERRAEFVGKLLMEPPAGERGRFLYSNAGYALLGVVAERVGGRPWEALVADEVFAPLGMKDARLGRTEELGLGPSAVGHARTPDGYLPNPRVPPVSGVLAPAGAANLTLADFAAFAAVEVAAEAGRATTYLGEKAVAELAGLKGGGGRPEEGGVALGSEGSFTAGLATWPAKDLAIVVLTNGGFSGEFVEGLAEAVRAAYAPDARPIQAGPPRPPLGSGPGGAGPRLGVALRVEPGGDGVVEHVAPGSAGEALGLVKGDRITAIDGAAPGKLMGELPKALTKPGARVEVVRDGKALVLTGK